MTDFLCVYVVEQCCWRVFFAEQVMDSCWIFPVIRFGGCKAALLLQIMMELGMKPDIVMVVTLSEFYLL